MVLIIFHCALDRTCVFSIFDCIAFVVQLFTLSKGNFNLGTAVFEVYGEGNAGETLLLNGLLQLDDLFLVSQQLSLSFLFVVVQASVAVGGDACVYKPQLAVVYANIGLLQAAAMVA